MGPTKFLESPILVVIEKISIAVKGQPKWDKVWQSKFFDHHPIVTIF
jgi:hypothetical protein